MGGGAPAKQIDHCTVKTRKLWIYKIDGDKYEVKRRTKTTFIPEYSGSVPNKRMKNFLLKGTVIVII